MKSTGWAYRVCENLGWHYALENSQGMISVYPSHSYPGEHNRFRGGERCQGENMRMTKEEFGQRAGPHIHDIAAMLEGTVVTIIARKEGVDMPYCVTAETDIGAIKESIDTLYEKNSALAGKENQCELELSSEPDLATKEKGEQ